MNSVGTLMVMIVFALSHCENSYSQGRNNIWLYGYNYPNTVSGKIDFSSGSPVVDTLLRQMHIMSANANITDTSGNLLFYTNGCYICNYLNDTMVNGSGLNPGTCTDDYCQDGVPIAQADLILPSIGQDNLYYLFHETCNYSTTGAHPTALYYSVIDMDLDSGKGEVISKNNLIINDTLAFGAITSVKHANGRDWWIVVPNYYYNSYHILLLTPQGIIQNNIQQIGTIDDPSYWPWQAAFSNDGSSYAKFMSHHGIDLLRFDRCSGVFFDYKLLEANDTAGSGGINFSPNGRFLYVSAHPDLYQFDLWDSDIQSSRLLIGTYDGFYSPPNCPGCYTTFYLTYLAPDNKIYIIAANSTQEIHVINEPDSLGLSCDFQQHSFDMLALNALTVPNHPNYHLGALDGICDSLNVNLKFIYKAEDFVISPNPFKDKLNFKTQGGLLPYHKTVVAKVHNLEGKILSETKIIESPQELNLSFLIKGVYVLSIEGENSIITKKLVKIE